MFKRRFATIVVWVTVLSMVMPFVAFAGEGDLPASFSIPGVTPGLGVITATDPMTPQQAWMEISVPVEDDNTLADIDEVRVVLFNQKNWNGNVGQVPGVGHPQTCAILTWTRGAVPEWALDQGSGTTWAINGSGCTKPNDTAIEGNWVFSFKVGKVASQGADWNIYATADDGTDEVGSDKRGVEMNWYGEIAVNSTEVDWGEVVPGTGFGNNVNKQSGISVTYVSNGDYSVAVKSSATWAGGASPSAMLDEAGECTGANEFALKASSDGWGQAELVDSVGKIIDSSGGQTGETGDTVDTNTLWLKLAGTFAQATYNGTITYIIGSP